MKEYEAASEREAMAPKIIRIAVIRQKNCVAIVRMPRGIAESGPAIQESSFVVGLQRDKRCGSDFEGSILDRENGCVREQDRCRTGYCNRRQ
jgi:hypothetical protein